jgi:hypothetical protein
MAKRRVRNQIDNLIHDHSKLKITSISLREGGVQHPIGKILRKGYNFSLDLISIKVLHTKLWVPKVAEVLTLRISGLSIGSFETKCHLGVSLGAKHTVYYKREGGGLPQVRAVVSLVSLWLPVVCPCTKSVQTMH